MTNEQKIERIHESLINGQRKQMTEQIDEFGMLSDFFSEYIDFLKLIYLSGNDIVEVLRDTIVSYYRIKER